MFVRVKLSELFCVGKIERGDRWLPVSGSVNNVLFACKGVNCRKQDERMNVVSFFFGGRWVDDKNHYEGG